MSTRPVSCSPGLHGSFTGLLRPPAHAHASRTARRLQSAAMEGAQGLEDRKASSGEASSSSSSSGAAAVETFAAGKRVAVLQASKSASHPVLELQRPLGEYMTLPASQYSVLDAQRVERLDADTFRCHVGGLKFLGFEVEPVITVSVVVGERGPTVRLLETKLQGSRMVQRANDRFQATMQNAVEWRETAGGGRELASDTSIRVALQVPGWFRLPTSVIESTGCAVMRRVLDTAVPRFLQQLGRDYEVWAAGDESRAPLEEGGLGLDSVAE